MRSGAGTDQPILGYLKNGAVIDVDTGAAQKDSKGQTWYPIKVPVTSPSAPAILYGDEALTQPAQFGGFCVASLVTMGEPVVHPPVSFSVEPASITAGERVLLSWKVEGVSGVWLDGVAEAGEMTRGRYPKEDTAYKLTVQYRDGVKEDFKRTVKVKAAPAPVTKIAQWGVNGLFYADAMRLAYAFGHRFFLVMENIDFAAWLADLEGTTVLYRPWVDHKILSPQQMVDFPAMQGCRYKKLVYLGPNEGESGLGWGTPQELLHSGQWWREFAAIVRSRGAFAAVATWAVGNPDHTQPAICDAVRDGFAEGYNKGEYWIDYHNYSPNKTNIFDTRVFDYVFRGNPEKIRTTDWWETRWHLLFTRCGFDPKVKGIVSGETALDEGGSGGLPGHNMNSTDVVAFVKRWIEVQSADIEVLSGPYKGTYPSPYIGGAVFQCGDASNEKGHWGSYNYEPYVREVGYQVFGIPRTQTLMATMQEILETVPQPPKSVYDREAVLRATLPLDRIRGRR